MSNRKKARGVPDPDHSRHPDDMPAVTTLEVCPDVDNGQFPLDAQLMVAGGDLTAIGLMRNATQDGKAGVLMVVTLPDGRQVAAQTTWALMRTAFAALNASPAVAEEVIDP